MIELNPNQWIVLCLLNKQRQSGEQHDDLHISLKKSLTILQIHKKSCKKNNAIHHLKVTMFHNHFRDAWVWFHIEGVRSPMILVPQTDMARDKTEVLTTRQFCRWKPLMRRSICQPVHLIGSDCLLMLRWQQMTEVFDVTSLFDCFLRTRCLSLPSPLHFPRAFHYG